MNSFPNYTTDDILHYAGTMIYEQGRDYQEGGTVEELVQRGDTLHANVEGSGAEPYHVAIHFTATGIGNVACTCPYGGWCAHVVATLLTALKKSETIESRPVLEELMKDLTRDQLISLVLQLAQEIPNLDASIEAWMAQRKLVSTAQPALATSVLAGLVDATDNEQASIAQHASATSVPAGLVDATDNEQTSIAQPASATSVPVGLVGSTGNGHVSIAQPASATSVPAGLVGSNGHVSIAQPVSATSVPAELVGSTGNGHVSMAQPASATYVPITAIVLRQATPPEPKTARQQIRKTLRGLVQKMVDKYRETKG